MEQHEAPTKKKKASKQKTLLKAAFPLNFRYANRHRQIHDVETVILKVNFSRTSTGEPRVTLWARDLAEEDPKKVKSYYAHRIIDITDENTGEITTNTVAILSGILSSMDGHQPPEWPLVRMRLKKTIAFMGPDETPEGWFFHVPAAFRAALDIVWTQEVKQKTKEDGSIISVVTWEGWTEGLPPALSFSEGDTFHAPSSVRRADWGQQRLAMTHLVQIQAARPCSSEDPSDPGEVTMTLTEMRNGTLLKPRSISMTQVQFCDLLRDGVMPDGTKLFVHDQLLTAMG